MVASSEADDRLRPARASYGRPLRQERGRVRGEARVVEFPRSSVGAEATRWRPWRTDAVASEVPPFMGHRSVSLLHMDVVLNCTSYTHMSSIGLHSLLAARCYVLP